MDKPDRILIVDDEEPVRQILSEMLESLGFEVEHARDGYEALANIELDIDLVLMDVEMPGLDGFEVIQRIRTLPHPVSYTHLTLPTNREV